MNYYISLKVFSLKFTAADTSSNAKVYISSNSEITPDKITVNAASTNNTGNAEKDLGAAGKIVSFADDSNNNNPHASSPKIKGTENIKKVKNVVSLYFGSAHDVFVFMQLGFYVIMMFSSCPLIAC